MAATMALQGRLLPQLFDNTALSHFLDGTIDVEADFEDLSKEMRYIIRKVPLYWHTYSLAWHSCFFSFVDVDLNVGQKRVTEKYMPSIGQRL